MSLLVKMVFRAAYVGNVMRPHGAGKQNIQYLMCEMMRSSKLLPPIHRTVIERHVQYCVKDCTPLFACMQAVSLGYANQLAFYFDPAIVISAAQALLLLIILLLFIHAPCSPGVTLESWAGSAGGDDEQ
jgi:hypothetical protein